MKRRISLLVIGMVCATSIAWAQDRTQQQHPSSDRARAGVGLGLQIHIPFGALSRNHPQRITSVPANGGWTSCGLYVTPGMHVAIDVREGRWASGRRASLAARSDTADANGYADSVGREPNAPLARANLGALIARVGNGPPFFVGSHYLGDPPGVGDLQLAINDDLDRRGDNRGVITATCVASHDTPAYVPPPPPEPPKQEAPPEPAPRVVATTKPAPAPEPQAAPAPAPVVAPTPEPTVITPPPEPTPAPPPAKPATPWGWIIAAIIAGAALITLIARAAGAGAAAAGAITTRIVDNGIPTQQLTIKSGKKK